jgi:simple sugar transport system permease protein
MRKLSFDSKFEIIRFSVAIMIALLLSFIIILLVSDTPFLALQKLYLGPIENLRRFGNVIELAITLSFAGLSIAIIFSSNEFNLASEGAFYCSGAVAAMFVLSNTLPAIISPFLSILLGGVVGAVIVTIPALLKKKWGASELVSSLMLNFIVLYFARYFINNVFKDPSAGYNATYILPETARLSKIVSGTRIHSGLIILIITVIACILFMEKTKWGFELTQVGRNRQFAKYVGINTSAVVIMSQVLGGFIAGVGGAVETLGMYTRFQWQSLPGYGFDGVIVAILAKNKPRYVPIAAFFLAYIRIGADKMATSTDVTSEMIAIIQGIIIMLVAATAFLSTTRQKMLVKEVRNNG